MAYAHQPAFVGGELAAALHTRVDLNKFATGLALCRNWFVHAHGGVSNRPGTEFIAEVKDSAKATRVIPFAFNTEQTYTLEFGDQYMRVIKDGGQVLESSQSVTGATAANPIVLTVSGHGYLNGDEVYVAGMPGDFAVLNGRNFLVANATTNTFELQHLDGTNVDGSSFSAYTSGGTVARVYEITTPYVEADLFLLKFSQSADVMTITHPSYATRELGRTGHTAWTLTTVTFGAQISAPTGVSATNSVGTGSTTYRYKVTAYKSEDSDESIASSEASCTNDLTTAGNYNTVSWNSVAGADRYFVYKHQGGVFGFIGVAEGTSFEDDRIEPDTTDTPVTSNRDPFSGTNNYPSCSAYYQQRRVFGATNNKPQTSWLTQIGNYYNLNTSYPLRDDDAITATLNSLQVNEIRHLVPTKVLIAFTSGGEWVIKGTADGLTPATMQQEQHGYRGCSHVRPLVVGNGILFIQEKGSVVRDLAYNLEADGYAGSDLTVLASHLFEGYTIDDWDYAQVPHSIVWAVRSDGNLNAMTYLREHDVWAWHRHDTKQGEFESVCSISEGDENATYFVVKRTINGVTKRFIERLHTRQFADVEDAFFVDCGLTYDGAAATVIQGLWHLEGEEVAILADGNVIAPQTVTNGQITLSHEASKVHIGLAIEADLKTLRTLAAGDGGVLSRKKVVSRVILHLDRSRGLFVGPDESSLREIKQRSTEDYGEAIALVTGDEEVQIKPKWKGDAQVFIRQSDPLPATLLSISVEAQAGG